MADPPGQGDALSVLVVDDHEVLGRGLALLLRTEGFEIAGVAQGLDHATVLLARRPPPRLAIVDLDLEMASGFELITTAHAAGTRVLIYSDRISPRLVDAARAAGADGLASKACRLGELVEALRTVGAGQCFVDPRFRGSDDADPPQRLTAREREVVTLVATGLTGEEIAALLFLAPDTVRTHIRNAMRRLQARTRAQLVALAAQAHEIELPRGARRG